MVFIIFSVAKNIKLCVLNTHLESEQNGSTERIRQFQIIIDKIRQVPNEYTAILGGDMNVRENEVIFFF
jgi:endonuclease/exonuclease/phosphatase family metal-dependent hydrolase